MPIVTPKMELLIDLNKPAEEIKQCIAIIANSHPGKQLEILQQVDLWLGEQIIKLEEGIKKNPVAAESTTTDEKTKKQ